MDWMAGKGCAFTYGSEHGYLVLYGEREVRLARFLVATGVAGLTAVTAREAAESTITFPLGRGPGRPGGEPELRALAEAAKAYAERFEAGESLEGYPAWQRKCRECGGTGLIEAQGCTCGAGGYPWPGHEPYCGTEPCPAGCEFTPPSAARFRATGDANDCPSC